MERIEIIKAILNKNIYRTWGGNNYRVLCLHTYDSVIELNKKYPSLSKDKLFTIIASDIHIKNGTLTTFIWGYSAAARKINALEFP